MSKSYRLELAAVVFVAFSLPTPPILAQDFPPPVVTKSSPKPNTASGKQEGGTAGGGTSKTPSPTPSPTLLLWSDWACNVSVDGDKVWSVPAKGKGKSITVRPGQHLLSATTPDGMLEWNGVVDAKGGQQVVQINLAPVVVSPEDFDKVAARVWIAYRDLGIAAEFAQATLSQSWGFHDQNISPALHMANQQLQVEMEELTRHNPKDPSRRRVLDEATKVSASALKFVDLMTKAITAAQSSNSFMGQPLDLYSQANAILATTKLSADSWATLSSSDAFRQALPKDRLRELRIPDDGQDFELGIGYMNVSPLLVAAVRKGSLAEDIGFRPGDRLASAGGRPLSSVWDLKLAMRQSAGQPLEIVFDRKGKAQKKAVKVPAQLPRPAAAAPAQTM